MYGLHKAFVAEIAKAPAALLRQLINDKLAAEEHADRSGFAEALTEHLFEGNTDSFESASAGQALAIPAVSGWENFGNAICS
jgi:hypothetical protein